MAVSKYKIALKCEKKIGDGAQCWGRIQGPGCISKYGNMAVSKYKIAIK